VVPFWPGALAKKAATNLRSKQSFASCVTFFSEAWNQIFPQALGRAVQKNMEDNSRFFLFGPKITNQNRIHQKNTPSQRALSYFFTTEAAEVKRAGGNEKTARFDRSIRSLVT